MYQLRGVVSVQPSARRILMALAFGSLSASKSACNSSRSLVVLSTMAMVRVYCSRSSASRCLIGRCGHFWEARYFSTPIHPKDQQRMLSTLRYIHANPKAARVRKGFYAPIPTTGTTAGCNQRHDSGACHHVVLLIDNTV